MKNWDLTMKKWDLTIKNWDLTMKQWDLYTHEQFRFNHENLGFNHDKLGLNDQTRGISPSWDEIKKTSPQNNGDLFVRKSKKTWVKMLWFFKGLTPKLETFGDGKWSTPWPWQESLPVIKHWPMFWVQFFKLIIAGCQHHRSWPVSSQPCGLLEELFWFGDD